MIKANATDINMSFEVIGADDNDEAINFTIKIEFTPSFQRSNYQIRNVLIDKDELYKFEEQLQSGDEAELSDINAQLIMHIKHTDDFDIIEVQPLSSEVTTDYDRLNITMYADHLIMSRLGAAFKKYPKWW